MMAKKLTKKDRVYLEPLARLIHEAGRAGAAGYDVKQGPGMVNPFVPWEELSFDSQEIRYLAAHFLADRRRMASVNAAFDYAGTRR
jgi:hypothetical protein